MAERIEQVPINRIDADPQNPRGQLSDKDSRVQEFAEQLRENPSIYQPLRLLRSGARYRIIIGERRWRAARIAGMRTVPAIVEQDLSEVKVRAQQLAEMAQQNEVPTYRQYEAWAAHVRQLVASGIPRSQAVNEVAGLVGKSPRTIASSIGAGYVEAPKEIKALVERGEVGPSVVGLLNSAGLSPDDRVALTNKIATGTISTTGTTIQSELMPRIRKGDEISRRLVRDPNFTLHDAIRSEQARSAATREQERRERLRRAKENARERPRAMSDISLELERDLTEISAKLRALVEMDLVSELRLDYLKSSLRVFSGLWEQFAAALPRGVLPKSKDLPRLSQSKR